MASPAPTTRRTLFAIAAGAALVPAAAMAATATATSALEAEARAIMAQQAIVSGPLATDDDWNAWEDRRDRFFDAVEALPCTQANLKVKAIAFSLIHPSDENFLGDDPATDQRLAAQIVRIARGDH